MTKKKKNKISLCLSLPELVELNKLLYSVPRSQKEFELFNDLPVDSTSLLKTMRVAGSALSQYESEDDSFYFIFSQLTYIFSRFKYSLTIGIKSNDTFILECLQHHPVLFDAYLEALIETGEVKSESFMIRAPENRSVIKTKDQDVQTDDNNITVEAQTQTEHQVTVSSTQTEPRGSTISVQTDESVNDEVLVVQPDVRSISIQTDLPLDFACQVEIAPTKPIRRQAVKKKRVVKDVKAPSRGKEQNKQDIIYADHPPTKMSYSAVLRQATNNNNKIALPSVAESVEPGLQTSDVGTRKVWKRRIKTVVKRFVTKITDDDGFISFVKKKIKIEKPYCYRKRPQ